MVTADHSKKRVSYYYDSDIGSYYYGQGHVMKPQRIRMCHHLLLNYKIYPHMEVYRPQPATFEDMTRFHSSDYIRFLKTKDPRNLHRTSKQTTDLKLNDDCPAFDGLYEFCQKSSGGSLAAAVQLNKRTIDIAINWMGGLHHAKKSEASGFCYTNDIVLGILELLKHHQRVLYVDIDVHHGDGVEEAFYTTDRVMTVSFHKYGNDFFPGTGDINSIGAECGRNYAVNIPLRDGIADDNYKSIFTTIMRKVMEVFNPSAVVLQCGADSLNGDSLGSFNLTLRGHGQCVEFFRKYDVPLMLLGGGGYTPQNVARCWTYETALAVGMDIPDELPYNDYFEYFAPSYRLHIEPSHAIDENNDKFIASIQRRILENLNRLQGPPGVQMQPILQDVMDIDDGIAIDAANPDKRLPRAIADKIVDDMGELYDDENEGGNFRNEQLHKRPVSTFVPIKTKKSRNADESMGESVKPANEPMKS